jgi:hypothetical protein
MRDKLDHLGGKPVFSGRIGDFRTGQQFDKRLAMAVGPVSVISA